MSLERILTDYGEPLQYASISASWPGWALWRPSRLAAMARRAAGGGGRRTSG